MRIHLLMTGSELLSGTTIDSNATRIANSLAQMGLGVTRKHTVGDDLPTLINEIASISRDFDLLITNGGLGPTQDDLTSEALAQAAGVQLQEHADAKADLIAWCEKRRLPLNGANLKQVMLPAGCFLVNNPIGSAVGFGMQLNGCVIICTPGVPRELEAMLASSIPEKIRAFYPDVQTLQTLKLQLFGIGESQIQEMIPAQPPAGCTIGFRAGMPTVELKLLCEPQALTEGQAYFDDVAKVFAEYVVASGAHTLSESTLDACKTAGLTVATAESCTGGLISAQLTAIAGSSDVLVAGLTTYANSAKQAILGVNHNTLEQFGAVSEQTAREMHNGCLRVTGADIAVAVTGIAGPTGGSSDKPVGTVWISWGSATDQHAECFWIAGERTRFQQLVAAIAQDLLRRTALNKLHSRNWQHPPYFYRWVERLRTAA